MVNASKLLTFPENYFFLLHLIIKKPKDLKQNFEKATYCTCITFVSLKSFCKGNLKPKMSVIFAGMF